MAVMGSLMSRVLRRTFFPNVVHGPRGTSDLLIIETVLKLAAPWTSSLMSCEYRPRDGGGRG